MWAAPLAIEFMETLNATAVKEGIAVNLGLRLRKMRIILK